MKAIFKRQNEIVIDLQIVRQSSYEFPYAVRQRTRAGDRMVEAVRSNAYSIHDAEELLEHKARQLHNLFPTLILEMTK